jgi:hypothetical protein
MAIRPPTQPLKPNLFALLDQRRRDRLAAKLGREPTEDEYDLACDAGYFGVSSDEIKAALLGMHEPVRARPRSRRAIDMR